MKTRRSFRREGRILISGPTPRPERETGGTGVTPRRISRFRETGRGTGATAPSRRPNAVTPLSPPRSHLEGAFSLAVPPVSPRNASSQDQGAASRSWIGTVAVPCGAAQLLLRNRRNDHRVRSRTSSPTRRAHGYRRISSTSHKAHSCWSRLGV